MRIDELKKKFFLNGMYSFQITSPPDSWKQQKEACNCYSNTNPCYDSECPYRGRNERYPADVGGEGQCLRLALLHTPFAFRNVDGRVIEIPVEIAEKILDSHNR
jgi:hypothetical protein